MIRFGPAGNSKGFYDAGYKATVDAAAWLSTLGLNAFEYSFGRGVNIGGDTARKIGYEMKKYGIAISVHAPYFINFANPDPEKAENSFGYVFQALEALDNLGGTRCVVHTATTGGRPRGEAIALAAQRLEGLAARIADGKYNGSVICLETMGKFSQIGTAEEIIAFCKISDCFYPCFDFGHINCYMQGGLKTADGYKRIIDLTARELGEKRADNMHIHFSKIQYGPSGEIRHLDLSDTKYGPDFEPLARVLQDYKLNPVVICESAEIMAEDALRLKKIYTEIV
ncbi:MAG: TIM barrel protein [Clostridiales bacterium]|jgi:deoxyribonuclease-4|nr:TIM barrel protein [Clostridiales bacterium]